MRDEYMVAIPGGCLDSIFEPEIFWPLGDVVKTLSHICRFNGRVSRFWSVLDHSILLWSLVPPNLGIQALAHDFAEAWTGDLPAPVKRMPEFSHFRKSEKALEKRIWNHYAGFCELDPIVSYHDRQLALAEANALGLGGEWSACAPDISIPQGGAIVGDFMEKLRISAPFLPPGCAMSRFLSGRGSDA